jgi:hypothetical protein
MASALVPGISVHAAERRRTSGEYFLIGDGSPGDVSLVGAEKYSPVPGAVRIWQVDQERIRQIPLPFFPHSFSSHPSAPQRVITIEKWGRHLAEIDLTTMTVVRLTKAPPGRRFFGHGVHAGAVIYATQMDDVRKRGMVSVLDSATHKVLLEFETHGMFPHDCQWLAGTSNVLLIVNSRSNEASRTSSENFSSLVWLDAGTGQLLKQIAIRTKEYGYAHLAQSRRGDFILSGSYNDRHGFSKPLLAVIHSGDQVQAIDVLAHSREHLRGEILSLYLHEDDEHVTVTLPNASRVQTWNYQSGELMKQANLAEPRGIAYSAIEQCMIISSARKKNIIMFDKNLEFVEPQSALSGVGGSGSHFFAMKPSRLG